MNREQTLEAAMQAVMHDRNADYQDPEDNFLDIAYLWEWYLGDRVDAITPLDVAIMSTMIKFARMKGNPYKEDNFVDGAGYMACAAEVAEKMSQAAVPLNLDKKDWKGIMRYMKENRRDR